MVNYGSVIKRLLAPILNNPPHTEKCFATYNFFPTSYSVMRARRFSEAEK